MTGFKKINIDTWNRKELFYNFLDFESPFFNICADVKVNALKEYVAANSESYFIASYYLGLRVFNEIEAFRFRIREKEVIVHDVIRGACTIMKEDQTFGFGYFPYHEKFSQFRADMQHEIDAVKKGVPLDPQFDKDDLIHSSVIPWVSFRGFEHAKRFNKGDSVPKFVMGKIYESSGDLLMPVSVSGHHALMDGLHIGQFFEQFQQYLLNPEKLLSS